VNECEWPEPSRAGTVTGSFAGGTGVSAEVARKLLCDAGVVPVHTDETGNVLDVGRKSRTVPTAMRRALRLRDGQCQFPGCDNRRWLDAHHIHAWVDGGATSLENLVELCPAHHRYLHEYGYQMARQKDGIVFYNSQGEKIVEQTERPALAVVGLAGLATKLPSIAITEETNNPGCDGLPPDYRHIVNGLHAARCQTDAPTL